MRNLRYIYVENPAKYMYQNQHNEVKWTLSHTTNISKRILTVSSKYNEFVATHIFNKFVKWTKVPIIRTESIVYNTRSHNQTVRSMRNGRCGFLHQVNICFKFCMYSFREAMVRNVTCHLYRACSIYSIACCIFTQLPSIVCIH